METMKRAGISWDIYFSVMYLKFFVLPLMLLTDKPSVTNKINADCSLSGLNTMMIRIFWNPVNLLQQDGNDFYGYSSLYQGSNSESLKFTAFATLGTAAQKWLKDSCLSKFAHVGKITLFSRGTGKIPVKNYHSLSDMLSGCIPFKR